VLLRRINAVYADKVVQDELDDREGLPRMPLRPFLLAHFLREAGGDALRAEAAVVALVASVAAHVRGATAADGGCPQPAGPFRLLRGSLLGGCHQRIALFGRFLGLEPDLLQPIGPEGLGLFLGGLRLLSKGAVLDLPATSTMVPLADLLAALEWLLGGAAAATMREEVAHGAGQLAEFDGDLVRVVDMELALELLVDTAALDLRRGLWLQVRLAAWAFPALVHVFSMVSLLVIQVPPIPPRPSERPHLRLFL
jgi:hypothetical protein